MDLKALKAEAEKFRRYVKKFDKDGIATDANALTSANPGCPDCQALSDDLKGAGSGAEVEIVLDEVKNR